MTWASFAIAPRRRLIVTALMYVTLIIRMTSAVGEEASGPVQAAHCAAFTSIPFNERPGKPAFRMADIQGPPRTYMCGAGCQPTLPT